MLLVNQKTKTKRGNAQEGGGGQRGKVLCFCVIFLLFTPNYLFIHLFLFCCLGLPPSGAFLLMNELDLTACLELNLLSFLSRIFSVVVVASGVIRVARPPSLSHPKT